MPHRSTDRGAARRVFEPSVLGIAVTAFVLWTIGVTSGWADRTVDTWLPVADVDPRSPAGQIAEAFALVTDPFFIMAVTAGLAVQAYRRRHRHLAGALAVGAAGMPLLVAVGAAIGRPRPETPFADSIAAAGPSYPSGHVAAMTILIWVGVTVANSQRRSRAARIRWRLLGAVLVTLTAVTQWMMSTARLSDMVGGALYGALIASAALWISGIEAISHSWATRAGSGAPSRRAAVVYNPTKFEDLETFRRRVTFSMRGAGWAEPLWLETRADDPGREMARDALAKEVDRVVVAGGDGTVRAVCAELAGSHTPVAVIPAGTGNLLCRNLGIPLDEDEALELALAGTPRRIDVVRWTVGGTEDAFVVMAGVGLDAQIMRDTNPHLKRMVKGGAYVVAGIQQIGSAPFHARVTVDGRVVHDGDTLMTLVGNVGKLQGGIALLPAASAGDGHVHVLVAAAEGLTAVKRVANVLRRGESLPFIKRGWGTRVEVELDREVPFQLDGDTEGTTASFTAEAMPGALRVVSPPRDGGPRQPNGAKPSPSTR